MKRILLIAGVSLMFFACSNHIVETKAGDDKDSIVTETLPNMEPEVKRSGSNTFWDTVKISYTENKDLLEILKILPDSALRTWSWSKQERGEFVKFISVNNFTVDTTEMYMTIKKVKPNTIGIQVVDGYWTLSIYKVGPGNYIVITDDRNGDGNDLNAFEYDNGKLSDVKFEQLFGDFFKEFLFQKYDTDCWKFLVENWITFGYNFDNEANARIFFPYLNKGRSRNCLKGNALEFHFNEGTKKFELIKVSWLEN